MIGKTILNYTMLQSLDRSGISSIFLAEHALLKHKVVLKLLLDPFLSKDGVKQRFIQEAQTLTALTHPNLVRWVNLEKDPVHGYVIVMDYMEGQTLRAFQHGFVNQKIPLETLLPLFLDLLDGMGHAHDKKIIHGDLTPNNILISPEGKPIISNFGIAKWTSNPSTASNPVLGNLVYKSPEQIQTPKNIDHRSDIYTLGVILSEMWTGKLPYQNTAAPAAILDARLNEILAKATDKKIAARYKDCAAFKTALMRLKTETKGSGQKMVLQTKEVHTSDKKNSYLELYEKGEILFRANDFEGAKKAWTQAQNTANCPPYSDLKQKIKHIEVEKQKRLEAEKQAQAQAEAEYASNESYRLALAVIRMAKSDKKTELNLSRWQLPVLPSAITGLTQLTTLCLGNNQLVDISILKGLTRLTTLDLSSNPITDISVLKGLTQLTTLDLRNNQIVDISVLKGFTQLKTLHLENNAIVDISSLKGLTQLKTLYLGNNPIVDISVLKNLTQLTELSLDNNPIVNFSVLKGLTQLKTFFLNRTELINISFLSGFTQLEILDLSHNQITDISILKGFTQLKELNLENNQIEHFNLYLTQFQTLYYFDVSKNPIKNIPQNILDGGQDAIRRYQEEKRAQARTDEPIYASDKSYLAALERIQAAKTQRRFVLDLEGLNLEILPSAIQDLTELTHLNLKKNQIRDISMLKGFTQLKTLDLSNNRIQDISMLNNFTQLTTLNLQNNKIAGFSLYLQLLPELNYFNISGNLVENIKNMPRF